MRIGIVKPDYKITGGFEVVVNRMKQELELSGHRVEIVYVDETISTTNEIPCSIDGNMFNQNPDFFKYINSYWKYMKLDLNKFDAVISTQPPSFAIDHPKHIALFYHHMKVFYDLSSLIQEVGLNKPYHRKAVEVIREIDTLALSKVSTILAGSKTIQKRINYYNNLTNNIDVIYAGIDPDIFNYDGPLNYIDPIVVGRHEFPKRPELFVKAMKFLPKLKGRIVGEGGRTDDLKKIDEILTYCFNENINIDDNIVWKKMSNGNFTEEHNKYLKSALSRKIQSNISFTGRVSKEALFKEYANALCVICPAYEEDYGLTAIEAMAFKKPVIACKDGGGYAELIQDGVNGYLVEPTSEAIAAAVERLSNDKELCYQMGQAKI
ncbi:glycosyltransferase family 4 protein [Paenibacillus sp. P26]|nr:glycosyltransferase family 4 protein [Paenibacillus sp. P26]